ncbi:MAG: alpha/beta fold hydrolase [Spirochaetales bacterium]|nr:alpha/beta fold hydrolase [Spirochaetales bacterium]
MNIKDASFSVRGETCDAELFSRNSPENQAAGIIVMGHGFAACRSYGLDEYIRTFTEAGWDVLAFDYRGFGKSGGTPRRLVKPSKHLEDWTGAIEQAQSLLPRPEAPLVLWGSSYGGGHALTIASRRSDIQAVIAQVPHVAARETLRIMEKEYFRKALGAILKDGLRAALHRPPFEVPVVAKPGELAAMNTPDAWEGYKNLVPEEEEWRNSTPGRSLFHFSFYNPADSADAIECPVLIMAGKNDSLIPIDAVRRTAEKIRNCTLETGDFGHFDIYKGELCTKACSRQVKFLKTLYDEEYT